MTVEDLLVEVFEALGEPSDLYIYDGAGAVDLTQSGSIRILKWVNRAYKRIVNWKFPNGSQVRFPMQSGEVFFKTKVISGTAVSGAAGYIELDSSVGTEADRYNGWVLKITGGTGSGQVRLIVDFDTARLAYVDHDFDTTPDATSTYELYKRRYWFREATAMDVDENIPMSPVNQVASVLKISDPTNSVELTDAGRIEDFADNSLAYGTPCSYVDLGESILFDVAADEEIWFRLEYSKIPDSLTALTDEPKVPVTFHEPIALYAQWLGLRRSQEWGGAYSTKRDIEDLMQTLKTSLEMSFERKDIGAYFD